MTDAEYEAQKARVERLREYWARTIGLGWWDIRYSYCRERDEKQPKTAARTQVRWWYTDATIDFYLPVILEMGDDELEKTFVHELMHIFIAEAQHVADDSDCHGERVCCNLADAFVWLRDAMLARACQH